MKKIIEYLFIVISVLASGCYDDNNDFFPVNDNLIRFELGGFIESQCNDIDTDELKFFKLYGTEYYIACQKCIDDDNFTYYYRPVGSMQKFEDRIIFLFCPTDGQIKESIKLAKK